MGGRTGKPMLSALVRFLSSEGPLRTLGRPTPTSRSQIRTRVESIHCTVYSFKLYHGDMWRRQHAANRARRCNSRGQNFKMASCGQVKLLSSFKFHSIPKINQATIRSNNINVNSRNKLHLCLCESSNFEKNLKSSESVNAEKERRQKIEDELKDSKTFIDYLAPRPVLSV